MAIDPNNLPDEPVFGCPPCTGPVLVMPTPGSIKTKCAQCKQDVWLGPKQQAALLVKPAALVVCFLCAAKLTDLSGEAMPIESLGGQSHKYAPLNRN